MKHKLQFAAALLVGAAYRLFSEAKGVWVALRSNAPRVTEELKQQRLEACRGCPVYYKPLGTCGSPLAKRDTYPDGAKADPMGCFCFMEVAAGVDHRCWFHEQGVLDAGWKLEMDTPQIWQKP